MVEVVAKLWQAPEEKPFSLVEEDTVESLTLRIAEAFFPNGNTPPDWGLYWLPQGSSQSLYLSNLSSPVSQYNFQAQDQLILKPKPVYVPVVVLQQLFLDSAINLDELLPELGKAFGLSAEESDLIELKAPVLTSQANLAFGVLRGKCGSASCDCEEYKRDPRLGPQSGGACQQCGHYPASHKNLRKLASAQPSHSYERLERKLSLKDQAIVQAKHQASWPLLIKFAGTPEGSDHVKKEQLFMPAKRISSSKKRRSSTNLRRGMGRLDSEGVVEDAQYHLDMIRNSPASTSFQSVLDSIKYVGPCSPRLKKWAVRFNNVRQSEGKLQPLFGVPLSIIMQRNGETYSVPLFLLNITQYMSTYCLDHLGLFRLSGNQQSISALRMLIDQGLEANFSDYDADVIASLFKLFLQNLPDPILTHLLYPRFICVATLVDKNLQLAYLTSLVNSLPPLHRDLLRFVLKFLGEVTEHEESNKMGVHNLSIVFGPLFLRTLSDDPQVVYSHANLITALAELLLTHRERIFQDPVPSLHTVKALNSYDPRDRPGALHIQEGNVIHVFKKEDAIWYGEIDGRVGMFPRADLSRTARAIIITESASESNVMKGLGGLPALRSMSNVLAAQENAKQGEPKNPKKKREKLDSLFVKNPIFGMNKQRRRSEVGIKTLPLGFDPSRIEDCLSDKEYEEVLGVSKEKYFSMSPQERTSLKEKLGLM